MKMDEYLKKKNEIQDKQKGLQDRMSELEEARKKAKEIEESIRAEKKRASEANKGNFTMMGMQFRPWTLNDMVIILFIVAILVVGGVSFIPGEKVASDTDSGEGTGFFANLFGGFTVKSVDEETTDVNNEEVVEAEVTSEEETVVEPVVKEENSNQVDFEVDVRYQDKIFSIMNITGHEDYSPWYSVNIKNMESFNIKCDINPYVNDILKNDISSTITLEAGNERNVNLREKASDAKETLSRIKIEISCSDGSDSSTENTKVEYLKFYFS